MFVHASDLRKRGLLGLWAAYGPRGWSEPGFAVGEVGVAGVLGEQFFEGGDDLAGVVSGAAVAAGDEDHAVVARAAGCDGVVVQWPKVAEVVGDHRAPLGPGQGQDFGVGECLAVGMPGDGLGVVAVVA